VGVSHLTPDHVWDSGDIVFVDALLWEILLVRERIECMIDAALECLPWVMPSVKGGHYMLYV
jgi:hypothetical protein